jgi:hypothetical protein
MESHLLGKADLGQEDGLGGRVFLTKKQRKKMEKRCGN